MVTRRVDTRPLAIRVREIADEEHPWIPGAKADLIREIADALEAQEQLNRSFPIRHRRRRRFQLPQPIFLIVLMVSASIVTALLLQELVGLHHRS